MTVEPITESLPRSHGSLIGRLTAPRKLLPALLVIVCITFGAQVRAWWQHDGAFYAGSDVPLGGDLLAFYGAGRIIADGQGERLYDLAFQVEAQARVLDRPEYDGFLPFAYPAFVAAPYALLAQVPLLAASVVSAGVMLAAAVAAVLLLRPVSATVRERPVVVTLALLASQPLAATIFGGQTVAFSLLCFAGGYAALRRERDLAAGVWLGLLLYKPPLVLPLLALLLWRRQWRPVAVACGVGLLLALVGVAVAGPWWPIHFLDLIGGDFAAGDAVANGMNMISLLGVSEQLFGEATPLARGVAVLLGLGAVFCAVRVWRHASPIGQDFPLQFGFAVAVTLLLSPHALYYEVSLLALPVLALIDRWRTEAAGLAPGRRLVLLSLFTVGVGWPAGALLGVQPLFVVPIVVGVLMWSTLNVAVPTGDTFRGPFVDAHQRVLGRITYGHGRKSAHDGGVGET